jgi:hypothetical protein
MVGIGFESTSKMIPAIEMNASGCNVHVNGFVSDESAVEHLDG